MLARRDVDTMQTLLVGSAQHRGDSARMPFRRNLFAVLFAASLLSACSANGSTGEEQVPTGQPTSVTSVPPQMAPARARRLQPEPEHHQPEDQQPEHGHPRPGTSTSPPRAGSATRRSNRPTRSSAACGSVAMTPSIAWRSTSANRPTPLSATVVKQLTEDGSATRSRSKAEYFYAITLTPADAHDTRPSHRLQPAVTVAGNYMQQYKLIGDFEGVVTYGLGVRRLAQTASGIQSDPNDPRHIVLYFDLGPQTDPDGQE